jgi:hypothetical protein
MDRGGIAEGLSGAHDPEEGHMATKSQPIGVKELSEHLGTDARTLRAFLRKHVGKVGKGSRYSWPSLNDAAVKKLATEFNAAQASAAGPEAEPDEKAKDKS